ncbi:MAG: hypothetical protein WD042_17720 [Phycisphaeraceae bacterium]
MSKWYLPKSDSGLLGWARNFGPKISASPGDYGLSEAQAAAFAAAAEAYAAAFRRAGDPQTRTRVAVVEKNAARAALRDEARELARVVRAHPGVTDEQRSVLGLTVPRPAVRRTPAPAERPTVQVVAMEGRTATLRLATLGSSRRGRPVGAIGAMVMSHAGANWPADPAAWRIEGVTTRTKVVLTLRPDIAPGSKVWFTAKWLSPRLEPGPMAHPEMTYTQFGGVGSTRARTLAA